VISMGFKVSLFEKGEENVTGGCEIWGSHGGKNDDLLCYDTMWTHREIHTFQKNIGYFYLLWVHTASKPRRTL
jgi:hypothetical protein